jgi:class 3 adenylate cyclase
MSIDYDNLCDTLSMTEIIRLQDTLSKALARRFSKNMALGFSDVVGSTSYFEKFGNEEGRRLQQRHFDLINQALAGRGRIVDTAGDGAFLAFPEVDDAAGSLIELQKLISADNLSRDRKHQLSVRIGLHLGTVLTDGTAVTGDPVNYASRVAGTANPGEIRMSRDAFLGIGSPQLRLKCSMLPPVMLKGIGKAADLLVLDWRDRALFPVSVRFETGEEVRLPEQDIISFGRLKDLDGVLANDVVLEAADKSRTQQISRWHFELRRHPDGFHLKSVGSALTEVDGAALAAGQEVAIRPGTTVRVANCLTLQFVGAVSNAVAGGATIVSL